jgi:ATP-dependent Clp protease ATP-binding subunit ClpA
MTNQARIERPAEPLPTPDGLAPHALALLRQGRDLAAQLGHAQVEVTHLVLALFGTGGLSVGLDVERARVALSATLPRVGAFGQPDHFAAGLTADRLMVTPAAMAFLREYGTRRDGSEQLDLAIAYLPLLGRYARPAEAGSGDSTAFSFAGYGRDLTQLARLGDLDPLIGRADELARVVRVLCRKNKRNPLLVGPPGVGKSAIIEGLATRIAAGEVPPPLRDARVVALSLGALLAGTRYRGEFEQRVEQLLDAVGNAEQRVLLLLDEAHLIVRTGAAEGGLDLSSILLSAMARGDISVIGTTTPEEFETTIAQAGPLRRRIEPIEIAEPSPAEALVVLAGLRPSYESFHHVRIEDSALAAAIEYAGRGRRIAGHLPDSALELIDEACVEALPKTRSSAARPLVRREHVVTVVAQRTGSGSPP